MKVTLPQLERHLFAAALRRFVREVRRGRQRDETGLDPTVSVAAVGLFVSSIVENA
jgi:hypothetical protein